MIRDPGFSLEPVLREPKGRRVTVMGLGLFGGGVGAALYFARRGAEVVVTDLRPESKLGESLKKLEGSRCRLVLGQHSDRDFRESDLIVASPAVPPDSPWLRIAHRARIPIETEISIFLRLCRGKTIGVTGSNGKTTTSHLIAEMLRADGRDVFLGGNMGVSLLHRLDEINTDSWVVLELSSFQLEILGQLELGPIGAVVLNITPNHLDRHKTLASYEAAKRQILNRANWWVRPASDTTILEWRDRYDSSSRPLRTGVFGERVGLLPCVFEQEGALVASMAMDSMATESGKTERKIIDVSDIPLMGGMNRLNVMAASQASLFAGANVEAISRGIRGFHSVAHRLEKVGEWDSIEFYNDSVSTTPESTIAALKAFDNHRLIFMVGGHDKGCDIGPLLDALAENAAAVVAFGSIGATVFHELQGRGAPVSLTRAEGLADGLEQALIEAKKLSGSRAIVLSPAFPSYDEFRNFEERGDRFRLLIRDYVDRASAPEADAQRQA